MQMISYRRFKHVKTKMTLLQQVFISVELLDDVTIPSPTLFPQHDEPVYFQLYCASNVVVISYTLDFYWILVPYVYTFYFTAIMR